MLRYNNKFRASGQDYLQEGLADLVGTDSNYEKLSQERAEARMTIKTIDRTLTYFCAEATFACPSPLCDYLLQLTLRTFLA
jgi:hypothetical protein